MADHEGVNVETSPSLPHNANHPESSKIVDEFQMLLDKSQKLFAGLRDLPPTGGYKQWHPYFQRTFEVYTKLWKFQQQHRQALETEYGLKRWEIGEVASKIGQLYYHYYLRTSETNYLHESYVFYDAIFQRNYFGEVFNGKSPHLVIKKLRYYARFIVVCLLLNKKNVVKTLTEGLTEAVYNYTKLFKPADAGEWQIVVQEIAMFIEADTKFLPHEMSYLNGRLPYPTGGLNQDKDNKKMKIQEAILVGNRHDQIKFSELTLDIYRILQILEREPISNTKASNSEEKESYALKRPNPKKYLLYRPNLSQFLVFLSTSFKELSDNSALLLYLSADGAFPSYSDHPNPNEPQQSTEINRNNPIGTGGLYTSPRKPEDQLDESADPSVLYPADLFPFCRKPLFLIIDSNNSVAFKNLQNVFNQPIVCLMSPTEYPPSIKDCKEIGDIFTLFLYSPLLALCFLVSKQQTSQEDWTYFTSCLLEIESHIENAMKASDSIDRSIQKYLEDDFTCKILVRYVLCSTILRLHVQFTSEKNLPSITPSLPMGLFRDIELLQKLFALIDRLGVKAIFKDTSA